MRHSKPLDRAVAAVTAQNRDRRPVKHLVCGEMLEYKHRVKTIWDAAIVTLGLTLLPIIVQPQVGGNLTAPPPLDIFLEITTGPDGPILSVTEFKLITGEYYRLNITSDGGEMWRLEVNDLLQNSHLRVVTINEIEVHLQSMVFRAIEFDVAGSAQFSFTPIRTGTHELRVGDVPTARRRRIEAGESVEGRVAIGRFIVE